MEANRTPAGIVDSSAGRAVRHVKSSKPAEHCNCGANTTESRQIFLSLVKHRMRKFVPSKPLLNPRAIRAFIKQIQP